MSKFSENFKALRKSKNLSQADLGNALHISKSSINMYERGEREPSISRLMLIADFYEISVDSLIGYKKSPGVFVHRG